MGDSWQIVTGIAFCALSQNAIRETPSFPAFQCILDQEEIL